jgi:putative membrane protein
MKKTIQSTFIAAAALLMFSCENRGRTDAVDQAQDQTEERLEARGDDQRGGMEMDDADQIINLASGNMFEVEAGRLAAERAQNAEVKKFGQMMVDEHTKAGEQLRTLAQNKNIVLPTQMGNDHRDELNDLREKQGAEFDREYMDAIVSAHDDDINRVEDLQDSDDQDIRSFAQNLLPNLRKHHQQAQDLEDRVSDGATRADRDTRRRTDREQRGGYRYRVGDGAADARPGTGTDTRTGTGATRN